MGKILFIFFLFLFLAKGQFVMSKDRALTFSDSTQNKKKLKHFTLADLTPMLRSKVDSSVAITFNELPLLGYQGLADLFRIKPQIQIYDFLEMGLPRFVSFLHLWPQQTPLVKNGFLLNDPLSGLYNARLIFPDALAWLKIDPISNNDSTTLVQAIPAVRTQSRFILQPEPYTRIMYREGDFAYTDLDITFATQINPKTAIQLGGINRDYALTYYRGMHYRAAITHLINNKLIAQVFYHKSGENVNFLDQFASEFGRFRYNEVRENIRARLFFLNDQRGTNWQFDGSFENSRRKYIFSSDGLRFRLRFDRYALAVKKQWHWKQKPFLIRLQTFQVKAWGSPYSRKYTDTEGSLIVKSKWPFRKKFSLKSELALQGRWGQNLQWSPMLALQYERSPFNFSWTIQSFARFPTINERFFNFAGIKGRHDIVPERHFKSELGLEFKPTEWNSNRLNLVNYKINNEIQFQSNRFVNMDQRQFSYLDGWSRFQFNRFVIMAGGQVGLTGQLIGADYSSFFHIRYQDHWYHHRALIKASGTLQWFGPTKIIAYQPYAEVFYLNGGKWPGRLLIHYKISATIKDAILFLEMDNVTGEQYQIIKGYPELYRRVRVGLSWVLWN